MKSVRKTGPDALFVGAPTRLAFALNDLIRTQGAALRAGGVTAHPNKIVTHALRLAIGDNADATEIEKLFSVAKQDQRFLSALYAMGRPSTAIRNKELFPQAERMLVGASSVLSGRIDRVVVAIEPVQNLLVSIAREEAVSRADDRRWEILFEVSWSELLGVVAAVFLDAEIVVLTPHAVANGASPVLHHLFGDVGFSLGADSAGDALIDAAGIVPQTHEITKLTGLDTVACDLLSQRFEEDVTAISQLSRVRVF